MKQKGVILILLISVLILYGCIEQTVVDTGGPAPDEPVQILSDQPQKYFSGGNLQVGTESLIVQNIMLNGEVVLLQGSNEIIVYGTNNLARVGNKEIIVTGFNLDNDPSRRYALIKVVDIDLGDNEYLFTFKEEKIISGVKVKFESIDTDDYESILVVLTNLKETQFLRIHRGDSQEAVGLKVTNIRPNRRPISAEKYAIIKVEPL